MVFYYALNCRLPFRKYNVYFFIDMHGKFIGLQVKPAGDTTQISQIYKEKTLQASTHSEFTRRFGGQVFYVISMAKEKSKQIQNPEVIEQIREEIIRLSTTL